MTDFQTRYDLYRGEVEAYLQNLFADAEDRPYGRLQEAMRYSLLAGGKRVRPVLALAVCEALGGDRSKALPLGCALELVHTYSLIHDDLPCMDDDDLRRGQPTCHIVYGEATAVLAGDALLAEAFRLIASAAELTAEQRADAVLVLSGACGGDGMVAGQLLDVDQLAASQEELRQLCELKTGALIRAAAELGCIAAGADGESRKLASSYAGHLGLAFQVRDDILDVTADESELGKSVGSDRDVGKRTFVDCLGLADCEALAAEETRLAKEAAAGLPESEFLLALADHLAARKIDSC